MQMILTNILYPDMGKKPQKILLQMKHLKYSLQID